MVPAGLAISGVSAHACSHHRGCRGQPVCTGVTTPTRTTGGPLGGELTTAHAAASRPLFCLAQSPRPCCSPSRALSTAAQIRPQRPNP